MDTTLTRTRLHEQLLELKMKHAEKTVDQLCEEAATRQSGYTEFLSLVLDSELVRRRDQGTLMRLKLAQWGMHLMSPTPTCGSSGRAFCGRRDS